VTGLTEGEARALFVLTTGGVHEDLGLGTAARSAILKVMRAVPEPFRPAAAATSQRILVDPAGWMRGGDPVGQLGVLQAAVFTDRRLRLRYRSSGQRKAGQLGAAERGVPAERVVDPYGLVCKGGIWYLVAEADGEPRLFRVSRVVSAEVDEAPVRPRYGAVPAARTLLSFGANVDVVSPPEVRADLAEQAADVVALYSNMRLGAG